MPRRSNFTSKQLMTVYNNFRANNETLAAAANMSLTSVDRARRAMQGRGTRAQKSMNKRVAEFMREHGLKPLPYEGRGGYASTTRAAPSTGHTITGTLSKMLESYEPVLEKRQKELNDLLEEYETLKSLVLDFESRL